MCHGLVKHGVRIDFLYPHFGGEAVVGEAEPARSSRGWQGTDSNVSYRGIQASVPTGPNNPFSFF
jgi:hypothetical protein